VHIKVNRTDESPVDVNVVDLFGKLIYSVRNSTDEEIEINLENQLTGNYFALINVNGQTLSKKLVVQK
jgi:uncharacterized alkaline shock family protein YloU